MGEVWEDASNKEAYGIRRRYFTDGTLDSIMNYPFRTAILQFMRDRDDGKALKDRVMTIAENYPKQVLSCNMNLLGTHDTARILTALVDDFDGSRDLLAKRKLSRSQRDTALSRLEMATFLQYTLPGSPSIYYGDEAGMEGGKDPFNRRTFPWGAEDTLLQKHYMQLGQLRKSAPALGLGNISFFQSADGRLGFARSTESQKLKIYVNRSLDSWSVPAGKLLYGKKLRTAAPNWLELEPMGFCVVEE
jgi:glycosidase